MFASGSAFSCRRKSSAAASSIRPFVPAPPSHHHHIPQQPFLLLRDDSSCGASHSATSRPAPSRLDHGPYRSQTTPSRSPSRADGTMSAGKPPPPATTALDTLLAGCHRCLATGIAATTGGGRRYRLRRDGRRHTRHGAGTGSQHLSECCRFLLVNPQAPLLLDCSPVRCVLAPICSIWAGASQPAPSLPFGG